jgi:hypothetical protein
VHAIRTQSVYVIPSHSLRYGVAITAQHQHRHVDAIGPNNASECVTSVYLVRHIRVA